MNRKSEYQIIQQRKNNYLFSVFIAHPLLAGGVIKEEPRTMKQTKITYEAFGDTLLIHMPKELDHHNCRDLKRDTDLMLE